MLKLLRAFRATWVDGLVSLENGQPTFKNLDTRILLRLVHKKVLYFKNLLKPSSDMLYPSYPAPALISLASR